MYVLPSPTNDSMDESMFLHEIENLLALGYYYNGRPIFKHYWKQKQAKLDDRVYDHDLYIRVSVRSHSWTLSCSRAIVNHNASRDYALRASLSSHS